MERIDFGTYSDLHKDVHGVRPVDGNRWDALTTLQQVREFNALCTDLVHVMRDADVQERAALVALNDRLDTHAESFGVSFETALRWELDGEGLTTRADDVEFFLFCNGIHKGENIARYVEAMGASARAA